MKGLKILTVRTTSGFLGNLLADLKSKGLPICETDSSKQAINEITQRKFGLIVIQERLNVPEAQNVLLSKANRKYGQMEAAFHVAQTPLKEYGPNTQTPIIIVGTAEHTPSKFIYPPKHFEIFQVNGEVDLEQEKKRLKRFISREYRRHKREYHDLLNEAKSIKNAVGLAITNTCGISWQELTPETILGLLEPTQLCDICAETTGIHLFPQSLEVPHTYQSLVELAFATSPFRNRLGTLTEFDLPPGFYDK
jgi:hypothetical protein